MTRRRPDRSPTVHRPSRHRRRRRDQGGYALMFTLGIIALTSVVIVALLGLALTSARVAQQQAALAREERAADGALEAAVADIARSRDDPCDAVDGSRQVAFPSPDGALDVTVDCSPNDTPDPSDPNAQVGEPRVEIVGTDAYAGTVAEPAAPPAPGLTADPTFVATGTEPLSFSSDVLVNRGAAVGRTSGSAGPAVRATGQYIQRVQIDGGCGLLGRSGPYAVDDHSGAPTCDPSAAELPATVPSSLTSALPRARTLTCPAGPVRVLQLQDGPYSVQQSNALNRLLDGSCPGLTLQFLPGVHSIDINDAANAAADRNALVINDPTVRVVFGAARGWTPATGAQPANFPEACDPSVGGATLQLSGRTAIRHRQGRVAMCPAVQAGNRLPALLQTDRILGQPELVTLNPGGFAPGDALRPLSTTWATQSLCTNLFGFLGCDGASFATTWTNLPVGALSSVKLLMNMQQTPDSFGVPDTPASAHTVILAVRFDVRRGATLVCSTDNMPMGRSFDGTVAFDLKRGGCASALANGTVLDGASVTANIGRLDNGDIRSLILGIRNVRLEVNSAATAPTGATATTGGWSGPTQVQVADNNSATAVQDVALGNPSLRWETPGTTFALTASGFTTPSGLRPDAPLDSLQVVLRSGSNDANFLADPSDGARLTLDVLGSGGSTLCSATSDSHANSNQELRYDLLAGSCGGVISTASQLDGTSLRLTVRTGCADGQPAFFRPLKESDTSSRCASIAVPSIDVLAMTATTDEVTARPPTSEVAVAVDRTGPSGTSFDVYGNTVLPRADLDIHWKGAHFSRPLFGGGLRVHGLGSDMTASADSGLVCCSPLEGAAVLQASINGKARARAAVQVDGIDPDASEPLRKVAILDWKLCGRGGC